MNDYLPWEAWDTAGREDSTTRATKKWQKMLRDYEAPPIDEGIDEALRDYVARKKATMPDMWY
jgi:trimethylamine--corrinoid protein Co-methyltransferase